MARAGCGHRTDLKGRLSPAIYLLAVLIAFLERWVAFGLHAFVALMWLVPDRRVEARFVTEVAEPDVDKADLTGSEHD